MRPGSVLGVAPERPEGHVARPPAARGAGRLNPPSGVRWTAGTGFVSVAARDCFGAPARDITFSLKDGDPGTVVAHAPGSPADFLLADVNASSGYSAVFINVSPGRHVIEGRRDGVLVMTKEVVVRADWITTAHWMFPDPEPRQ
jgi:hypothetical protein